MVQYVLNLEYKKEWDDLFQGRKYLCWKYFTFCIVFRPDLLSQKLRTLQHKLTVIVFKEKFINLRQMMHLITKGFSDILNLC